MNNFLKLIILSYASSLCASHVPTLDDPKIWEEFDRAVARMQHPQTSYSAAAAATTAIPTTIPTTIPENFELFANQPFQEALPAWTPDNWDNADILGELLEREYDPNSLLMPLSSSPSLPSSPASEEEESSNERHISALYKVKFCHYTLLSLTLYLYTQGITSEQLFTLQKHILSTFEANVQALIQLEPSQEKEFLCEASIHLLHQQLKVIKHCVLNRVINSHVQIYSALRGICDTYVNLSSVWANENYRSLAADFLSDVEAYSQILTGAQ